MLPKGNYHLSAILAQRKVKVMKKGDKGPSPLEYKKFKIKGPPQAALSD
jgi:hypothetical protein